MSKSWSRQPTGSRLERRGLSLVPIALVFAGILVLGAYGYHLIEGWSWSDSLYMATITVTTVGFGEIHPLSSDGRVFTIVLIVLGVGGITYSFRTLADYVVEGELKGLLEKRRMNRTIKSMANHFIICGYGRLGHEVCLELRREGRPFVIVDLNHPSIEHAKRMGYVVIEGDAGTDAVLKEAGIDRATGLVASSDDDAKNILVVLSARALNPQLSIVARVSSEEATEKFIRAGANSVFLPYKTGGRRMAQVLLRPEVSGFLEVVLHDEAALGLLLENFEVQKGSELDGKNLHETRVRQRTGVTIVGLKRRQTGQFPKLTTDTVFHAGDTVIALGTREQLADLERILTSS